MNRRALVLSCAVVAGLCLCVAVASVAGYAVYRRSLPPPETAVELTGHMVIGFEIASFVPCAPLDAPDEPPGYGQGYWLSADPGVELYAAYHAAVGEDYLPAYVHVTGRLSPPGQYGHLGAYTRELTVTEILEINATGVCAAP